MREEATVVKRNNILFEFFVIITTIIIIVLILRGMPGKANDGTDIDKSDTQSVIIEDSSSEELGEPTGKKVYTIESGDDLWSIAAEYSNGDLDLLYELNPGLKDLKFILPGDTIYIPTWD